MINYFTGKQSGYAKYPFCVCLLDSRAKDQNWDKKEVPFYEELTAGKKNVVYVPIILRKNHFPLLTSN